MTESTDKMTALRSELAQLFERAKLPSSPGVAAQIIKLIGDPNSSGDQFARLIEADPALAARLLKMANASVYGQRRAVTTIQRAITVIGLRQLRLTVLGFELVGHLDRLGPCAFDLTGFWQQSVLRGCLAREVARVCAPEVADEAFLIGLLQDCGIPVLVQLIGETYASLYRGADLSPASFYAAERKSFRFNHVDAITALCDLWHLPEEISAPLSAHHRRSRIGTRRKESEVLDAISYFIGSLSLSGEQTKIPEDHSLLAFAREELLLTDRQIEECFLNSVAAYHSRAELFELPLSKDRDITDLMADANRQLRQEAERAEERVRQVEAERDEVLGEQLTLRKALGQYREQAAQDPLTGLLNRRALLDAAGAMLEEQHGAAGALGVMFFDIDDFKLINDRLGHSVGDEVLRRVSAALQETLPEGSAVGRYGGEEFIAVLSGVDEVQIRRQAARVLNAIRQIEFSSVGIPGRITCSLGVLWSQVSTAQSAQELFDLADELMYVAKRAGKDRACLRSMAQPETVHTIVASEGVRPATIDPNSGDRREPAPVTIEQLQRLAIALEKQSSARFASVRKQERKPLATPCMMRYLDASTGQLQSADAWVRSISTGGIGLLSGDPLQRGDLVEIYLELNGEAQYLAGLVAFCRVVEDRVHELGVQIFDLAHTPILSGDLDRALEELDWAARAARKRGQRPGGDGLRLTG